MKFFLFLIFLTGVFSFVPCSRRWIRINHAYCSNNNIDFIPDSQKPNDSDEQKLKNEYNMLKNKCCGEVNETNELEELEREFFEIYQKMKKYNKKTIIKRSQQLYRFFTKGNHI